MTIHSKASEQYVAVTALCARNISNDGSLLLLKLKKTGGLQLALSDFIKVVDSTVRERGRVSMTGMVIRNMKVQRSNDTRR